MLHSINDFIKIKNKKTLLITGSIFNSFWLEKETRFSFTNFNQKIVSSIIKFFDSQNKKDLPIFLFPNENAPTKYKINIQGGGNNFVIIGYSVKNLFEILSQKQIFETDAGTNYEGIAFFFNETRPAADFEFLYCLAWPTDKMANLILTVEIKKIN